MSINYYFLYNLTKEYEWEVEKELVMTTIIFINNIHIHIIKQVWRSITTCSAIGSWTVYSGNHDKVLVDICRDKVRWIHWANMLSILYDRYINQFNYPKVDSSVNFHFPFQWKNALMKKIQKYMNELLIDQRK